MKDLWIHQDPDASQEAEKYDNPVPSRTFIQEFLQRWGSPITLPALCEELNIEDEDAVEGVRRRLIAMCRDGQLMSNRRKEFGLIDKLNLISGRVLGHRDGFGFVRPDDGGEDYFLNPRNMRAVFDGDKVLAQPTGKNYRGKEEAKIIEILERGVNKVVGRYEGNNGFGSLVPENLRIASQIMIVPDPSLNLTYQEGQLVVAEIMQYPDHRHPARARVIEVLGEHMSAGMEIKVAINSHSIPFEWPDSVSEECSNLTPEVAEADKINRIDLRHLPLVTIDGEDARDFDDAVFVEKKRQGGWRLWVAIADVSYYVLPGTALDREAYTRGNSVYFPEYVVPMLPELLSNGLCSLNPHVDRLAMVCEMNFTRHGKMQDYHFYEAVINSKARLTYHKVATLLGLQGEKDEQLSLQQEYADRLNDLTQLHAFYSTIRQVRDERGAMDFDSVETRIEFGEDRKINRLIPVYRNDAHKIIEECMLCANVATAMFLQKLKRPAIYRIHEGPKDQKLTNLRQFLAELGLNLPGGDNPDPKDYLQLSQFIEARPDQHIIETMMLRSMQQAVYSPENKGHFGLAYDAYTHFTSPIRRYPDLIVHRIIRAAIHSGKAIKAISRPEHFQPDARFIKHYSVEDMLALGEHCSMTERRADEATRDVTAWLKCEYMLDQIGHDYAGVIAAVTGFGIFVEITELYVEGLVHISGLPSDYYLFEASKQRLIGERTKRVFKLGDAVRVKVVRVDLDERKIDFELVETRASTSPAKKSKRELLKQGKLTSPSDRSKTQADSKKTTAHTSKNTPKNTPKTTAKNAARNTPEKTGKTARKPAATHSKKKRSH